jgi:ribonuclease P protein component
MKGKQTFPKRERILRPGEFREVYREGARYSVREFLLFVKSGYEGPARLGLSVSKRIGTATTRNRIKRYVRETFRTHKGKLKGGTKVIVVARPGSEQLDFAQCREKVVKLFQEGNLIHG